MLGYFTEIVFHSKGKNKLLPLCASHWLYTVEWSSSKRPTFPYNEQKIPTPLWSLEKKRAASTAAQEYWPFPYQRATKYPSTNETGHFPPFFFFSLAFCYAFLLLPPLLELLLLAPSRIENFKVHEKDMTAVVIPRENWMLLFFFSATLEKKVAFSSLLMLGMLLKRQQKIHPSCGFDMSSTRWFFCLEYIPCFHILLVFLL